MRRGGKILAAGLLTVVILLSCCACGDTAFRPQEDEIFHCEYLIERNPEGYGENTVIIDGQLEWRKLPNYRGEDILKFTWNGYQYPLEGFVGVGTLTAEYADGSIVQREVVQESYALPLFDAQFRFNLSAVPKGAKKIKVRARIAIEATQDFSVQMIYAHRKIGFGAKYLAEEVGNKVNTFYDVTRMASAYVAYAV